MRLILLPLPSHQDPVDLQGPVQGRLLVLRRQALPGHLRAGSGILIWVETIRKKGGGGGRGGEGKATTLKRVWQSAWLPDQTSVTVNSSPC